jgi:predicted ArsR family transcriptional regulator
VLAARPEGLTAHEIAEAVGLHHNAVREHLGVLARAGVISSAPAPPTGRPGRPGIRHRLADPDGARRHGHAELVRLLMSVVRRAGIDDDAAEEIGRDEGRLMAEGGGGAGFAGSLAALGFAPEDRTSAARRRRGELELVLRHCPFREAVASPGGEIVCRLHRGLSAGLLEGGGGHIVTFEPDDPAAGRCRVTAGGVPPG